MKPAEEPDAPEPEPTLVAPGRFEDRIGRYRLCFELASGGMATVYLARAEGPAGFEKPVALKRIHPHLARERTFVEMFLDEARIASLIDHPNVCSVFDFGEVEGVYYIAMEYLVGEPLTRVMRAVSRRADQYDSPRLGVLAARVVADACEGLHAAHETRDPSGRPLDVVHRDVSPHNLFLTYDGTVRVMDFGIASASHRIHKTRTGELKGKFAYMSPEQLSGRHVDRRSDVWSLGVVLWEMLTCHRLFRRATEMETLHAAASDPIPLPSRHASAIPPELDAIVMRALARDPDERYASARDLGRDLVRWTASRGDPVGLADLAEWMEALFPDGLARRRQLIEMVRTFDASVPRLHEQEASSSSLTGAPSRSARMRARARDGGRERGSRSGMRLIATALVVVVALLGGYAIAELTRERPGAAAVSATASSPTSTELGGVNVLDDAPPPVAVQPAPPSAAMVPPPEVTTALDAQTPDEVDTNSRSDPESRRGAARARARAATHARTEPAATAPAPSASPPPAANATGVANIVTPGGWANIYDAEGRYLGQTPIRVTLPAGRHVLQARPFGQPAARRIVVNVTAGATARVVERLGE